MLNTYMEKSLAVFLVDGMRRAWRMCEVQDEDMFFIQVTNLKVGPNDVKKKKKHAVNGNTQSFWSDWKIFHCKTVFTRWKRDEPENK